MRKKLKDGSIIVLLEVGDFVIGLFVQKKTACYLLVRLGGGNSNILFSSLPGADPNFSLIFFKWLEITN